MIRQIFQGGTVLILVSKEALHKVLLTKINILTICFPPLERLRSAILVSFFPSVIKKPSSFENRL